VLICLTEEEVDQIARENRLSNSKNNQKHLKKDRNIAQLALGDAFKNIITGENPADKPKILNAPSTLKPIDPSKPLAYDNCEGYEVTTYADIVPGYSGFNKNKKKKARVKHQAELLEINTQRFEEFKQASKEIAKQIEEEKAEEDNEAQVIDEEKDKSQDDNEEEDKKDNSKGSNIDERVRLKICDLGNGCWTHHHFSSEIQTRQYRSPETIIGLTYGTSADIWSFACMIFEMITGDFLFEPRKGNNFDKDDDHLAQMMEILGKMPKNIAFSGRLSKRFFDKTGHLLKIRGLQHWPLKKVLMEKYRFIENEAEALADFLLPMLEWHPEKRATAKEMLEHPWLSMESNYDYVLSERDYQVMMLKNRLNNEPSGEDNKEMSELGESDNDLFNADCEDFNSTMSDDDTDDELFVTADTKTIAKKNYFSEDEDIDTRLPGPNYLNNSFTGLYPEDMNRNYADKGPNQQFLNLDSDVE